MDVNSLWKNEKKLRPLIGLEKNEAELLLNDFSELISEKEDQKSRIGGRPNKLSTLEYFFMLMFYIRHHPTYEVLGAIFGLAQSNAERRIEEFLGYLHRILKTRNLVPLDSSDANIEELKGVLEGHKALFADGTESPIRRPKEKTAQKENYSGKKKRHTSKVVIISDEKKICPCDDSGIRWIVT